LAKLQSIARPEAPVHFATGQIGISKRHTPDARYQMPDATFPSQFSSSAGWVQQFSSVQVGTHQVSGFRVPSVRLTSAEFCAN